MEDPEQLESSLKDLTAPPTSVGGSVRAGSSVGLFIYAALQRLLIEFYGLDGCLLIVGALALNILACGSLMRPLRSSDRPLPEKTALENVPDRYLVYNEKEKNLEENINILEKSYRGDETCKSTLANATLIIMSLALCAIPFAKSYVTLAILSGIVGFLTGNWSIFPYVTTKTVGIEKLAHAYGILMFFAGLGNSLGPPIVGWFFDWTQTYDIAFYFSGFCVLLGGFILLLAALPSWDTCNKQVPKPAPTTFLYKVASNSSNV
ncbi:hypothetical protein CB1_000599004 [Camelus ferus]|nr:hypothetical protein CB1_000599004 [Camelus ferus]